MRSMVMAAGLGTRLRPLTHAIPKPVVPVANVAIVELLVAQLASQGAGDVIANLHWFADKVEGRLGDGSHLGASVTYAHEEELLGTAGGVRGVADFLTAEGDEPFLVLAGDALTDVDLRALVEAHREHQKEGGVATLAVKRVEDVSAYGVVVTGSDGRVQGFQEKPDPAEALSDLVSCMIYVFSPEIFDYFPAEEMPDPVDFAKDVFPALLEADVPFHVHEIESYWNDIGTLPEFLQGNLDVVEGALQVPQLGGELTDGSLPSSLAGADVEVSGPVLFGEGCTVASGASLVGPLVVGQGAEIGEEAQIREAVLLPGAKLGAGSIAARAVIGDRAALAAAAW